MTIELKGRIDSGNAQDVGQEIAEKLREGEASPLVLDAEKLEYISSAGLRLILHLRKEHPELRIIGVNSDIYEILDMTGFTEMMPVEKAFRKVSIEGCEMIGRGANGSIYRIDQDNVVKVYKDPDALDDIKREREMAKMALILGIPTAISYDVVKVGECYGSVFELLNARPLSKILAQDPGKMDWCVNEYVEMLRKIHGTLVPEGKLPDMNPTALKWAQFTKDYLPEEAGRKLVGLVEAIPHDDHMIHGDYHTNNLMLQNDEVLLIDMDTLAVGHPVYELGSIFNSFIGYSEYDPEVIKRFQGFDAETGKLFWKKSLAAYLGTDDEEYIRKVEDKARIIGYTRMIRRSIRRKGLETEAGRAEIQLWKDELLGLLEKTDTLLFSRNELEVEAVDDNLPTVLGFIEQHLEAADCPLKAQMQISVAAEEIFINIAHYAYKPETGKAIVRVDVEEDPVRVTITFVDKGMPFDPLAMEEPDVSLPAEAREIGGLGVFLARKAMDDVSYQYKDGQNILTLKKNF